MIYSLAFLNAMAKGLKDFSPETDPIINGQFIIDARTGTVLLSPETINEDYAPKINAAFG